MFTRFRVCISDAHVRCLDYYNYNVAGIIIMKITNYCWNKTYPGFERFNIKGSFVIAAICKDGIIVAAESRANIFDKTDENREPIAYYDTEQKLFPIGQSRVIVHTGQGLILNIFFSAIVEKISTVLAKPQINNLLPTFIAHCQKNYPEAAVNEIKKQILFAAGYINSHPTICYFNLQQAQPYGCIQDSGFIESAPTILREHDISILSCEEATNLAEKAIQKYADEDDRWKTIGGPVSIVQITQDDCKWLKNKPCEQKWVYIQDFVRDYQSGDVDINLIAPATKQQLDELLQTVTGV